LIIAKLPESDRKHLEGAPCHREELQHRDHVPALLLVRSRQKRLLPPTVT
jgi:hypothetical protein